MIGKREANYKALEMAATLVENSDLNSMFGDYDECDEDRLSAAHANAVRRIRSLIPAAWVGK